MPEAIVLLDTDDRILQINPEFTRVFGYAQEEACGRLINELVVPEELLAEAQEYTRRGLRGERVDVETVRKRKSGTRVDVSIVSGPVSVAGSQIATYVIYRDITERKRAESLRAAAEEALSGARSELAHVARVTTLNALTASIAHEINQPLASLVTNASISFRRLNADPPNVDGARETLQRTIRDANRVSDVITRLRTLFSKKEFTLEPLDLNEATQEVIALSLSDLHRNRVILRPELAEDLPPVTGDRIQLQQVILNLLRNASDAMNTIEDHPRELLIKTDRDEEDRVRLSVKDVGVGFRPEAADKLFEAFYTTKNDGMGIGLSVSRAIIESHHGRLWATANDGPGVTFSFSIPYRSCDAEALLNRTDSAPLG